MGLRLNLVTAGSSMRGDGVLGAHLPSIEVLPALRPWLERKPLEWFAPIEFGARLRAAAPICETQS